jgi:hypothetical protein
LKLSDITLEILKSYSRISDYITINRENTRILSITNTQKTFYSYYLMPECECPVKEIILYKLEDSLKMIKELDKETLEFVFEEYYLLLKDKKTIFKYKYAEKDILLNINNKTDSILAKRFTTSEEPKLSFFLKKDEISKFIRIINHMKLESVKFKAEKDLIYVTADDTNIKEYASIIAKNSKVLDSKYESKFKVSSFENILQIFDYQINIYSNLMYMKAYMNIENQIKEIPLEYILPMEL